MTIHVLCFKVFLCIGLKLCGGECYIEAIVIVWFLIDLIISIKWCFGVVLRLSYQLLST